MGDRFHTVQREVRVTRSDGDSSLIAMCCTSGHARRIARLLNEDDARKEADRG